MRVLLALPLLLTIAGCGESVRPASVALPATGVVIPAPYPLPEVIPAEDLGLRAEKNRVAAAENARRLATAARNYDAVRNRYAGGQK